MSIYLDRRRFLSLSGAAALSLGFASACGGSDTSTPASGGGGGGGGDKKRVAYITNAPIADGGWNTSVYGALQAAAKENGYEVANTENVKQTDYVTTFRNYANQGFTMIFAPGNEYTDAVQEVAADFPKVKFALLNGNVKDENVASLLPNNKQIGYLAGTLAAMASKNGSVGFVGGMTITPTTTMQKAFEAAAKAFKADIKVATAYANSFDDTAKGKEIAMSMISTQNVDVFYGHASAVDSGVRQALKTSPGRYQIAQPSDLVDTDPDVILTSIVTSTQRMIDLAMKDIANNQYGNKIIEGSLQNNTLSIGKWGKNASPEMQTKFKDIVEKVKSGQTKIPE